MLLTAFKTFERNLPHVTNEDYRKMSAITERFLRLHSTQPELTNVQTKEKFQQLIKVTILIPLLSIRELKVVECSQKTLTKPEKFKHPISQFFLSLHFNYTV